MDDKQKYYKYQHLLVDGTMSEADILGNICADKLAESGARQHFVQPETIIANTDRRLLTKLTTFGLVMAQLDSLYEG